MSKKDFLSLVTVVDTETTNPVPEQADVVELATAVHIGTWTVQHSLFGVEGGIPPEASAKNQISNRMIDGLPTFGNSVEKVLGMLDLDRPYFVAHNARYDRTVLAHSWRRADLAELAEIVDQDDRWICTWRLSKHAYQHTFSDQLYGQNYLRYRLDLPVDDSVGVQRAAADVQVCAALLERLIDDLSTQGKITANKPLGPQLVSLTAQPIVLAVWPLGKHRGTPVKDLETDYLLWAVDNVKSLDPGDPSFDVDLYETVRSNLESRL
jgi:DNA polymerase III epsilon subunit-like protein